jgi:flagellar assembly factor FliW
MKLVQPHAPTLEEFQIHLPFGLIGMADLNRFDVAPLEGRWPFLAMRSLSDDPVRFIVFEPQGFIPGYQIELQDDDAECLRITSAEDALVLVLVTVHNAQYVTANLVGPVVVHRTTLIGKQVIVANSEKFSTLHPLIDGRNA